MPRTNHARHAILSETELHDSESGDIRVIIETPKGSRNKYSYDPDCDCFELSTVLPEGMTFPFDFGFLPSTLGEDGDPVDVLALMDAPAVPGCVVRARLVGLIEARQKEKGKDWYRNDRLIAVATHARTHEGVEELRDLGPHILKDINAFFVEYNALRDRRFEVLGDHGPKRAKKVARQGEKRFRRKRSSKH